MALLLKANGERNTALPGPSTRHSPTAVSARTWESRTLCFIQSKLHFLSRDSLSCSQGFSLQLRLDCSLQSAKPHDYPTSKFQGTPCLCHCQRILTLSSDTSQHSSQLHLESARLDVLQCTVHRRHEASPGQGPCHTDTEHGPPQERHTVS